MAKERLTQTFVDSMHENMWQFINLETLSCILKSANCAVGTSTKNDIWDENFENPMFHNTICFKGNELEGHYVYVDSNGNVTGTYENNLIYRADDGICHGAALAAAFHVPLIRSPRGPDQYTYNYRIIMNTYKYIIEKGWWDKALQQYFYRDVEWKGTTTVQTQQALTLINHFLDSL
jgi:hypothetical protein